MVRSVSCVYDGRFAMTCEEMWLAVKDAMWRLVIFLAASTSVRRSTLQEC